MKKVNQLHLFKYMKKLLPIYIIAVLFLSIIDLLIQIFLAILFRDMFNSLAMKNLVKLFSSIKYYSLIFVVLAALLPIFEYMLRYSAAYTTGNIRKALFENITRLQVNVLREKHSGDLISILTNDISTLEGAYSRLFVTFIKEIICGIGSIVFMAILDWRLAVASIVLGLIALLFNTVYGIKIRKISSDLQKHLGKLTQVLSDLLTGIHVIRSFNITDKMLTKCNKVNEEVCSLGIKRVKNASVLSIANFLTFAGGVLGILIVGAYLTKNEFITVGDMIASIQLQFGVSSLFNFMTTYITQIQGSLAAADRVFEVINSQKNSKIYSNNTEEEIIEPLRKDNIITFNKVKFKYDNKEEIFDDLNFSVKKGSTSVIVGKSGAGKSTIFNLILGFYKPDSGEIIIDGKSISKLNPTEVVKKISYVSQNTYLFSGTIAENIGYGLDGCTIEQIVEAAKIANAHNFITQLDKGYSTVVGEKGSFLSGGQRQRIAIARAVLKNAPILLLDEATSALDVEAEKLVQVAINKLMIGKTTLIITHKLSSVNKFDNILGIDNKKIYNVTENYVVKA